MPILGLRDPGVHEVGRLMAPRMVGLAAVQLNFLVNTILASGLAAGSLAALNYAWLLMLLPQGVFAQAVATAAFPTFSLQAARGQRDEMRSTLAATLRAVLTLALPAAVGLLVLGVPLIELLFERGAFAPDSTRMVAWALAFYAVGLPAHSLVEIVVRAFYALHDTKTPVVVGVAAMGLNVALSLAFMPAFAAAGWPPHGGLALGNSLATTAEMVILLAWIRRRLGGLEGRRLAGTAARIIPAAALMGAAAGGLAWLLAGQAPWLVAGVSVAAGVAVYAGILLLLRAPELRALKEMVHPRPAKRDSAL
jgi:putative peptidoglycan lipid II flippase